MAYSQVQKVIKVFLMPWVRLGVPLSLFQRGLFLGYGTQSLVSPQFKIPSCMVDHAENTSIIGGARGKFASKTGFKLAAMRQHGVFYISYRARVQNGPTFYNVCVWRNW